MEKWKKRSAQLAVSLLFGNKGENDKIIEYHPQKIAVNGREEVFFRRTVPEKKGISSRRMYNMLCELEGEGRASVHSLLVLCDGEVICECSANGYSVNEWHISHSMSKTVCGMIIGRLVDEGMLCVDRLLVDIFPEIAYKDKRFAKITVDHLLSMTTGVDFAEAGSITESDWTGAFFSSSMKFTPGSRFSYNSMNSYILARVAERISGRAFGELASEYIFSPLGIKNYLWEKGPEGTEKGGWGLYMSAESWAKVGYMLACDGVFMGKRVLSEEWVRLSSTVKTITPFSTGNFNYAYQMWTGRDNGEILFNGMLGQNVWICPKNKIVAVITSGNNEFFQDSPALEIVRKHLGGRINDEIDPRNIKPLLDKQRSFFDCRSWVRPKGKEARMRSFFGIRPRRCFDTEWEAIIGSYAITKNDVGFMPLILRVLQNNLCTVIERIDISRIENDILLTITEGGVEVKIRVGLSGYEENICSVCEEKYIVRAVGEAGMDAQGKIYKIELIFPETANSRMILIRNTENGRLSFTFSERPNNLLAENVLRKYRESNGVISFAADMLERRVGNGEIEKLIDKAFNPVLSATSTSILGYSDIVERENRIFLQESSTVKMIRALVDRFFKA